MVFVCSENLPFYTDYAFYGTPAAARSLSSLVRCARVESALGRVRTESVGTCRYGYCSERFATSGHGYSSHRSWCLPTVWMFRSKRIWRALGLTACRSDKTYMSVSIFRQTPASVATVFIVRRREALRTAAISACPDHFGPFLTGTRSRHRDLMRSGERVSV